MTHLPIVEAVVDLDVVLLPKRLAVATVHVKHKRSPSDGPLWVGEIKLADLSLGHLLHTHDGPRPPPGEVPAVHDYEG